MKVQILGEAQRDVVGDYRCSEGRVPGLGDSFRDLLFSDIDSLQLCEGIHAQHFGDNRLLSRRFPLALYHRGEYSVICVYAILDCRRDPSWIRDRLT